MQKDYTHITMVVDRSGSMARIRSDAEGGVNAFIKDQEAAGGKCTLTLVDFDEEYRVIVAGVDLSVATPRYELVPRGLTAMNDAIGKAMVETGEFLSAMKEEDRPGLVVFVIVTDGDENASEEYDAKQIKDMIKKQEAEYSWKFTFLAANIDAFAAGGNLGVASSAVMSFAAGSVRSAYAAASSSVTRGRAATSRSADAFAAMSYTAEERDAAQ